MQGSPGAYDVGLMAIWLALPWLLPLWLTFRRTRVEHSRMVASGIYAFCLWALQAWAFLGVRNAPWESGDLNHLTYVILLIFGTPLLLGLFLFAWRIGGRSRRHAATEQPPLGDYAEPFS